jgi:hypothetical protein
MDPNRRKIPDLLDGRWAIPSGYTPPRNLDQGNLLVEQNPQYRGYENRQGAPAPQQLTNPIPGYRNAYWRDQVPPGFARHLQYLGANPGDAAHLGAALLLWYQTDQTRLDPSNVPGQDLPSRLSTLFNPPITQSGWRTVDQSEWRCVGLLGEGGFGSATLWQHDNPGYGLVCQCFF